MIMMKRSVRKTLVDEAVEEIVGKVVDEAKKKPHS